MLKQLVMILALITFLSVFTFSQEKPETEKKENQERMKDMQGCCGKHEMQSDVKMKESTETESATAWNKVCPVKGNEVDPEVATVKYNGKHYGFCCQGCDSKFTKEPEKYSKNLNEDELNR